jgi:hypothetical protein
MNKTVEERCAGTLHQGPGVDITSFVEQSPNARATKGSQ